MLLQKQQLLAVSGDEALMGRTEKGGGCGGHVWSGRGAGPSQPSPRPPGADGSILPQVPAHPG